MNSPLNPPARPDPATPCLAMRPREAAKALGISPKTLWILTHEGQIPHARVGACVLYPVRELTDWLTKQAKAAVGALDSAPTGAGKCGNAGENASSSVLPGTIGGGK